MESDWREGISLLVNLMTLPAQVILRWQIQDGYITIPGSSNPGHIAENYDVFDFALTNREMMEIRDLDRQARYESW